MAEQEKRKFGTVKRSTLWGDLWQYVLEQFFDYKGFQRVGLITVAILFFLLLIAYFPAIILVGFTMFPIYFIVYSLVGKFRRNKYSSLLLVRQKHKKVPKKVTIGDNYDINIENIETTSDLAELKLIPESIISPTPSKDSINFINCTERRMPNGRKLYIGEAISTDYEIDEENPRKKQRGPMTVYGYPNETYGNIALLTAVAGLNLKVNPKFEKVVKKLENNGVLEPEDIARIRANMKKVYEMVDQVNDLIYDVYDEIQQFPFEPLDTRKMRKQERKFIVGMGSWKGEWAEKLAKVGEYQTLTAESITPHLLLLSEQANLVAQQLINIGLFSKQMQGRATLAALEQLLKIFGYDSEEIKRVIEHEVEVKGLIATTSLANENEDSSDDGEGEE